MYQRERHAIGGGPAAALGPQWLNMVADWFSDRFAGKPMTSERVYVDVMGHEHVTAVEAAPD